MTIKFIHAADLHLGSPFIGLRNIPDKVFNKVFYSPFIALQTIVDEAIKRDVDFVLLVGDLFDRKTESLRAQIELRNNFNRLKAAKIEVYITFGNHDYIGSNPFSVHYPGNVHIFSSEQISTFTYKKNDKKMANIYGFSFESKKIEENKAKQFVLKEEDTVPYHIAMLHGCLKSNTEHDRYAPFRLTDLTHKSFDYWALGHIHKRQILSKKPYIVYPGNIQGRHRKESGRKGVYEVTLQKGKTQLEFIQTSAVEFQNVTLDISNIESILDVEKVIYNHLQKYKNNYKLIDLTIISNEQKHFTWKENGQLEELIELINEQNLKNKVWSYIYHFSFKLQNQNLNEENLQNDLFIQKLLKKIDNNPLDPYFQNAMQNKLMRQMIYELTEEDFSEVRQEAKQYFLNQLIAKGGNDED